MNMLKYQKMFDGIRSSIASMRTGRLYIYDARNLQKTKAENLKKNVDLRERDAYEEETRNV